MDNERHALKDSKNKKMVSVLQSHFKCQCGLGLTDMIDHLTCHNSLCEHYGKKFKEPTVFLEVM